MSGFTLGVQRLVTAAVLTAAVVGCTLAGTGTARADEVEILTGPPPVETHTDVQPPAPAPAAATQPTNDEPVVTAQSTPPPGTRRTDGTRRATPPRKFEHWEVAPTIQFTFSSGSDIAPPGPRGIAALITPTSNTLPLDVIRLVGDARYRFNSRYALSFTRIAHTGATGRTKPVPISAKSPLGGTYGGHSEDYEERFLLQDQMDPFFGVRAGYAIRTRQCCPAAGAPGNKTPRIHTGFFSDMTWRTGPTTIGGKPWTLSFRWEEYKHNTVVPRPAADTGTKPTFQFSAYSNFFVWHQTKLVPYYGIEYFSTYFSYSNAMTETYRKVYGVQYRATRDVSWRTYVKNDQSGGALNATGDSAHKSTLFLEGTYRFHW